MRIIHPNQNLSKPLKREKKHPKPIRQIGKQALKYNAWRDKVAKPYLDSTYGHKCIICGSAEALDVDHIQKRGSHPELRMVLLNVRWLCRPCHIKVT